MTNEDKLKALLMNICGLHDRKGGLWKAIADAKAALEEMYPVPVVSLEYQWRQIPGFEDYDISTKGEIRRNKDTETKVGRPLKSGRLLTPKINERGYHCYRLTKNKKLHDVLAHRLVVLTYIGPCPHEGWLVRHLDGNGGNNDVSNLRWGSNSANQLDRRKHGSVAPNARINLAKATEIREKRKSGISQTQLAKEYGVSRSVVASVVNNVRYIEEVAA